MFLVATSRSVALNGGELRAWAEHAPQTLTGGVERQAGRGAGVLRGTADVLQRRVHEHLGLGWRHGERRRHCDRRWCSSDRWWGGGGGGAPPTGGGGGVDCAQQVTEVNGSGGCVLTLVSPANCATVNFGAGVVELAYTTNFTFCEGPHHLFLLGNPPSTWNTNAMDIGSPRRAATSCPSVRTARVIR
jgi:hypothetical protein